MLVWHLNSFQLYKGKQKSKKTNFTVNLTRWDSFKTHPNYFNLCTHTYIGRSKAASLIRLFKTHPNYLSRAASLIRNTQRVWKCGKVTHLNILHEKQFTTLLLMTFQNTCILFGGYCPPKIHLRTHTKSRYTI